MSGASALAPSCVVRMSARSFVCCPCRTTPHRCAESAPVFPASGCKGSRCYPAGSAGNAGVSFCPLDLRVALRLLIAESLSWRLCEVPCPQYSDVPSRFISCVCAFIRLLSLPYHTALVRRALQSPRPVDAKAHVVVIPLTSRGMQECRFVPWI